jgi:phosphatidate cytidylyltransferase
VLICISTDIGGYIFGKIFKGPKLTKISPKKTYSGMIGGYILSIIILSVFFTSSYVFTEPKDITTDIFIFILLVSTISQIGDIIISYFKRLSKIKDTGKIIPGHGGLLDRIDGMIFAFPFSYVILTINIFQYY